MFCVCPPQAVKATGDAEVVKFPESLPTVKATFTGVTVFEANAPLQVTTALAVPPPSVTVTLPMEKLAVDGATALANVKDAAIGGTFAKPHPVALVAVATTAPVPSEMT